MKQDLSFQDKMHAQCWTLTFLLDHERGFQDPEIIHD